MLETVADCPINRRQMLSVSGGALLSALIPRTSDSSEMKTAGTTRLIYLWNDGGGPASPDFLYPLEHSPKVDVPFSPLQTSDPGLRLTEMFPKFSNLVSSITLFRARMHTDMNHETAIAHALGKDKEGNNDLVRAAQSGSGLPYIYAEGEGVISASNYRENSYGISKATESIWDKTTKKYPLPTYHGNMPRLDSKWELLQELTRNSQCANTAETRKMDSVQQLAYQLSQHEASRLTSIQDSDIQRYAPRAKYRREGMLPLLAREIIRQGIANVVLVRLGSRHTFNGGSAFDMHSKVVKSMKKSAPVWDHSVSQLIQDHKDGMLPDTTIVCDTEFGRTPKINSSAGRDHFPTHSSWIISDALKPGIVVGREDKSGTAVEDIVTNEGFLHIVNACLGKKLSPAETRLIPKHIFQ